MIENPYAPPSADCTVAPQSDLLRDLKSQSTWRLFGLGVITLGVYYAHYCARQSRIINRHSGTDSVSPALTNAVFILSYASLPLFLGYFFVEEHHPIAIASNIADKLAMLSVMFWGFSARRSVNRLASFAQGDPRRINGFWTFLFSPLHFNYKINVINQAPVGAYAVA